MAVRGEYPALTKAFTAFASGFDTFQIPYFKAIHIQYNFFLNIISKMHRMHNRKFGILSEMSMKLGLFFRPEEDLRSGNRQNRGQKHPRQPPKAVSRIDRKQCDQRIQS